ncbi:Eco57I restriction-modification methylase domain-containing protein [Kitasatospora sp. NPDC051705]|uniref:Eco57I restriction-modification methylase domain-containing protein n=1 Tax=Kitasatospora sp. NPDC051705 TaxID=3364057 RepID=UPI0037B24CA8
MSAPAPLLPADGFTAVRIEGGVLSPEILARIAGGDRTLPGTTPGEYGLPVGRLGDAVSRSWAYLQGVYRAYRDQLEELPSTDRGTTLTRKKWLLPLFAELGYGQLAGSRGLTAGGRSFPISHLYRDHFPVHLVSWHTKLDQRPAGGARLPQAMMQDCLNSSGDLLWGVLSNGRVLRVVRDSTSLVGSAYVEFDLESIFDGDLYPDFFLLFALLHASRVELLPRENEEDESRLTAADCWLERWRAEAVESGSRFLRGLSTGLQQAVEELGTGFLSHEGRKPTGGGDEPTTNQRLRDGLRDGTVTKKRFNDALLRLVYRMIFLFVAEDRDALFSADTDQKAKERYDTYFSSARLRQLALSMKGDTRDDLWQSLCIVLKGLGEEQGEPRLGLPGLGGVYDYDPQDELAPEPGLTLASLGLPNDRLLAAVRSLARVRSEDGARWLPVDYRHLGAEELGGVYEWILALSPDPDPGRRTYQFRDTAGHSRKTSGSYYTPSALVDMLLESALDPVLDEAARQLDPVKALLSVTVCDPACGSGHFLVAAARRIAKRIAVVHTQETEPPVEAVERWLPEVVARCIHGVDLNRMAVDLAKFALWMQALEPGNPRPMSFLDAHIRQGNALLGTTPALLSKGIPDRAYVPLEGDDRKLVTTLRTRNKHERDSGQDALFGTGTFLLPTGNAHHAKAVEEIHNRPGGKLVDVHRQIAQYRKWQRSDAKVRDRRTADAWCAAFVWPTRPGAPDGISADTLRRFAETGSAGAAVDEAVDELSAEYGFFHWHLEFPHIFRTSDDDASGLDHRYGWSGGFSCVLGNPPWDRVKLQEKEFFASRVPEIAAAASKAARDRLIAKLAKDEDQAHHYRAFLAARRSSEGELHLLRDSDRFPLTGQGDVNTYSVFAETARQLTAPKGRMGVVVPTGIAVDSTTAPFFRDILEQRRLDSLLDFVTNPRIWTDVGNRRFRFSLLTVVGSGLEIDQAESWTLAKHPDELPPRGRRIKVNPEDLLLVNPNTGTMPMFRTQEDADITLGIYHDAPVLWRDSDESGRAESNPWGLSFMRMFDMANDSDMFWERPALEAGGLRLEGNVFTDGKHRLLPLYEAKFVHHYDHRLSCYSKRPEGSQDTELPRLTLEEKNDPRRGPIPRYWMSECDVDYRLKQRWDKGWLLGWRDVSRSTDERTLVADVIPRVATNHKFLLAFPGKGSAAALLASFSSFAMDYLVRQKMSGVSLNYFILKQIAILPPERFEGLPWEPGDGAAWFSRRVLELAYTADDLAQFARDLGDDGPPFRWDEERRAFIRAELDAAMFHLYGLTEAQVDHVMEAFPIVKGKDVAAHGEYRTKRMIQEVYAALANAKQSNERYVSPLSPPPGGGARHQS